MKLPRYKNQDFKSSKYHTWVMCPLCGRMREILKASIRDSDFTGVCQSCGQKTENKKYVLRIKKLRAETKAYISPLKRVEIERRDTVYQTQNKS